MTPVQLRTTVAGFEFVDGTRLESFGSSPVWLVQNKWSGVVANAAAPHGKVVGIFFFRSSPASAIAVHLKSQLCTSKVVDIDIEAFINYFSLNLSLRSKILLFSFNDACMLAQAFQDGP